MCLRAQHYEPLVEQHIDGFPPRGIGHEFRAGFAEKGGGIVDQLPGAVFNSEIDAAFRVR